VAYGQANAGIPQPSSCYLPHHVAPEQYSSKVSFYPNISDLKIKCTNFNKCKIELMVKERVYVNLKSEEGLIGCNEA
jgi:hypothetical protein